MRERARELRCGPGFRKAPKKGSGRGNRDLDGERQLPGERCKKEDSAAPRRVLVRITRNAKERDQRRKESVGWSQGAAAPVV